MSQQKKKLSQLPHEERLGDSTPSKFLRRLQRLAGEDKEDGLIRHIFFQRLPAEYHNILAALGAETPIEKFPNIADNIADLTSHSTVASSNERTPELADSMDKILQGLRKLDVWVELRVVARLSCVAYISSGIRHITVVRPVHLMESWGKA